MHHIYKSAGIIIKERKLLMEKDFDKEFYISPGGKLEKDETPKDALVRELYEEFKIEVQKEHLQLFGHYEALASGLENVTVHMDVFLVKRFKGEIQNGHKVEQILWINSETPNNIKVGSIFEHEVIPRLKEMDLID